MERDEKDEQVGIRAAHRRFLVDDGQNPFTRYAFKAITIKNPNIATTSTDKYTFEVTPVGIGQITTLRDKFEKLLGSIFYQAEAVDKQEKAMQPTLIHPMFRYLLEKKIAYDSLSSLKETEYKTSLLAEIETRSPNNPQDSNKYYSNKKALSDFIQQKIYQNYLSKPKSSPLKSQLRLQQLQQFMNLIKPLRKKYQDEYLQLLYHAYQHQDSPQTLNLSPVSDIPQFIEQMDWENAKAIAKNLCDSVDAIELLGMGQQIRKFQNFITLNRPLFRTLETGKERQGFKFSVRKYSQQPETVLHTVEEFMFLDSKSNKKVSKGVRVQLIRDIAQALRDYEKTIPEEIEIRRFYHYLNPHNIVFNQFTLKPLVKFQPVLLDALGLANRPMSIENRVTFFPTPRGFDFFQSLPEVDPETSEKVRLMLNDPFFGCMWLNGESKGSLSEKEVSAIKQQRIDLEEVTEKMLCWRYLLLSYYILNGREYCKNSKAMTETEIHSAFVKGLQQEERSIRKNRSHLEIFVGCSQGNESEGKQEWEMNFEGLLDYLGIRIGDELLEKFQYVRLKIYHNYRNLLLRQIIRLLVAENLLEKMYNVKKYMCIFCVIACEMLEEAKTLLQCELEKPGERMNVRLILDRDVRRLRHDKPYYTYLSSTFEKILSYEKRKEGDHQGRYVRSDQEGTMNLQKIKEMKLFIDRLFSQHNEKLNQAEGAKAKPGHGQQEGIEAKAEYNKKIEALSALLKQNQQQIRTKSFQVLHSCLLMSNPQDLRYHKLPDEADETTRFAYAVFNKRLIRIVQALCYFDPDQLFNWESLVIPSLQLEAPEGYSDKKLQIKVNKSEGGVRQQKVTNQLLDQLTPIFLAAPLYDIIFKDTGSTTGFTSRGNKEETKRTKTEVRNMSTEIREQNARRTCKLFGQHRH